MIIILIHISVTHAALPPLYTNHRKWQALFGTFQLSHRSAWGGFKWIGRYCLVPFKYMCEDWSNYEDSTHHDGTSHQYQHIISHHSPSNSIWIRSKRAFNTALRSWSVMYISLLIETIITDPLGMASDLNLNNACLSHQNLYNGYIKSRST